MPRAEATVAEMEPRQAFENSQLQVYYQPKYETQSLRMNGAEALLRWSIHSAARSPTVDSWRWRGDWTDRDIGALGDAAVCWDLCAWVIRGAVDGVAVISGRDSCGTRVAAMSDTSGRRACRRRCSNGADLGILRQDAEAGRRSLLTLKASGLRGGGLRPGYRSLSYLKRFRWDTLKMIGPS